MEQTDIKTETQEITAEDKESLLANSKIEHDLRLRQAKHNAGFEERQQRQAPQQPSLDKAKRTAIEATLALVRLNFVNDGQFNSESAVENLRKKTPEELRGDYSRMAKYVQELKTKEGSDPSLQKTRKVLVLSMQTISQVLREKIISSKPQDQTYEETPIPLSEEALNKLAVALTGKSLESLQEEERIRIGKRMWNVSQYLKGLPEFQDRQNIDVLERESLKLVGEEEIKKILAQKADRQVQEEENIATIVDPTGRIRRLFTDPQTGLVDRAKYHKYISVITASENNRGTLMKISHKFSRGLGDEEKFQEFLKGGAFAEASEQAQLWELARSQIRERLYTPRQVREYVSTTFSLEDKSIETFMQTARQALNKLPEDASMRDKLLVIGELVSRFRVPGFSDRSERYKFASLLDRNEENMIAQAEEEVICQLRETMYKQVLDEELAKDGYIVLAEDRDPEFSFQGNRVTAVKPGHVVLTILSADGKEGYYADATKRGLEIISAMDAKTAADLYSAYREDPIAFAFQTATGTITHADNALMADAFVNLATLAENSKEALELAHSALICNPNNIPARLIVIAHTSIEDRQTHIDYLKTLGQNWEQLVENKEKLENVLGEWQKLTVEYTYEEAIYDHRDLLTKNAPLDEWEDFFKKLYGAVESWFGQGVYYDDFTRPSYQLSGLLMSGLEDFHNHSNNLGPKVKATKDDQERLYQYYDALLRIGNVDVAIGNSDWTKANHEFEKFNFEAQYGFYKNMKGVAIAHRTIEREAFKILVKDKGIFSRHPKVMKNVAMEALRLNGMTDEKEIKLAADIGFRLFYTDFTYSVRMVFGQKLPGDQSKAGQKGQTLANIFDMLFSRYELLNDIERLMVDAIGEAVVRGATLGFNDGPAMLTHRRLLLQSIVRYDFMPDEALFAQHRDSMSEGGYWDFRHQLEDGLKKLERFKSMGGDATVTGSSIVKRLRQYFNKQGWKKEQLQNNAFLAVRIREELDYLDSRVKRYDSALGGERYVWDEEILAKILVYGGALDLIDGYFTLSPKLYNILAQAGAHALGQPEDKLWYPRDKDEYQLENPQLKEGKKLNAEMYDFSGYVYEQNLQKEIAAGKAARVNVDAGSAPGTLVGRKRWDEIYTEDNYKAYKKAKKVAIDGTEGKMIEDMIHLYKLKAEFAVGKNNWERIQELMESQNTLSPACGKSKKHPDGINHFKFKKTTGRKVKEIWEQMLDPNADMEGSLNRGKTRILSYADQPRECATDDKVAGGMAANKPGKSRFGDAGAAQQDIEKALNPRLAHPADEKVWLDGNGNNADYNDANTEYERNAPWLNAVLYVMSLPGVVRMGGEITQKLVTFVPYVGKPGEGEFRGRAKILNKIGINRIVNMMSLKSPLEKVMGKLATPTSLDTDAARNFAEKVGPYVTSAYLLKKIKRKRGISRLHGIPSLLFTILEMLGLTTLTETQTALG